MLVPKMLRRNILGYIYHSNSPEFIPFGENDENCYMPHQENNENN